ncbi:MAG: CPBP family intramembrane metalloprotease [Alphaproteobacteria bacterium]|nr:CPBP family intramembrane metalloprotease [Alphaproteobacteria bacterium]
MLPNRNPRFETYVLPARAKPQLWRLVAGLVVGTMIYLASVMYMLNFAARLGIDMMSVFRGHGTPLATSVMLLTFTGMGVAVIFSARVFQKRAPATLFGPDLSAVRRNFTITATLILPIMVIWTGIGFLSDMPLPNLPLATWLLWLPSSLVLVLLQTTSEELVFRGYLQQQLAARFSSRWIWWLGPALLFGLAHYDSAANGENAWLVVLDTFLIGLIAGDLTARTGNLGAAIGLHFTNNAVVLLFVSLAGDLSGLSLNVTPFSIADTASVRAMLITDITVMLMLYLGYLFILKKWAARAQ